MVDKIDKALKKLSAKERTALLNLLEAIKKGHFEGLDIKKLKNKDNIYRVRKGKIRIIFQHKKTIKVMSVERRSDKTYS